MLLAPRLVDDFPAASLCTQQRRRWPDPNPLVFRNSVFAKPLSCLFSGTSGYYTVDYQCLSTVLTVIMGHAAEQAPARADIAEGHENRPCHDERSGVVWLCRTKRVLTMEAEILQGGQCELRPGQQSPRLPIGVTHASPVSATVLRLRLVMLTALLHGVFLYARCPISHAGHE